MGSLHPRIPQAGQGDLRNYDNYYGGFGPGSIETFKEISNEMLQARHSWAGRCSPFASLYYSERVQLQRRPLIHAYKAVPAVCCAPSRLLFRSLFIFSLCLFPTSDFVAWIIA